MNSKFKIRSLAIFFILISYSAVTNAVGGKIGEIFIQKPDTTWRVGSIGSINTSCSIGQVLVQVSGALSCQPINCNSGTFGNILNGQFVIAYQSSSVPYGQNCADISQARTCAYGVLDGSYTSPSCAVAGALNCTGTPWGTILNGNSVTGYSSQDPATCLSQTRVCSNGVLSGTYPVTSCSQTFTYSWTAGSYGSCTAPTCGGGTQTRMVSCIRNDGQAASNSFCTGPAPTTSQSCNTQACTGLTWHRGMEVMWSDYQCSEPQFNQYEILSQRPTGTACTVDGEVWTVGYDWGMGADCSVDEYTCMSDTPAAPAALVKGVCGASRNSCSVGTNIWNNGVYTAGQTYAWICSGGVDASLNQGCFELNGSNQTTTSGTCNGWDSTNNYDVCLDGPNNGMQCSSDYDCQ